MCRNVNVLWLKAKYWRELELPDLTKWNWDSWIVVTVYWADGKTNKHCFLINFFENSERCLSFSGISNAACKMFTNTYVTLTGPQCCCHVASWNNLIGYGTLQYHTIHSVVSGGMGPTIWLNPQQLISLLQSIFSILAPWNSEQCTWYTVTHYPNKNPKRVGWKIVTGSDSFRALQTIVGCEPRSPASY